MPNTIRGKIFQIGDLQTIPTKSGNQFVKRELVLDASTFDTYTGEKRENYPSFNFLQRHVDDLNDFNVGDDVIVSFIISGRQYSKDGQTRYFNDVVGYKIEPVGNAAISQSPPTPQPVQASNVVGSNTPLPPQDVSNEPLPF